MLKKKTFLIFIILLFIYPNFSFGATNTKTVVKTTKTKTTIKKVVPQINILIVPGHDDTVWGTQYGDLKESDMNLVLASQIYTQLSKDKRFKVYITRNSKGYTKTFQDYFDTKKEEITTFKNEAKQKVADKITAGSFVVEKGVPHVSVNAETSIKLYGINKWANENKMDAVIHVHFDDYSRENFWDIGKFKGFTVYYPDSELLNSEESKKLGKSIFTKMATKYQKSNYDKEMNGFASDQSLIALGANQTLNKSVRSVLVEYGYIYEKMFRKSTTRHEAYNIMSDLTVKGIKSYFYPSK